MSVNSQTVGTGAFIVAADGTLTGLTVLSGTTNYLAGGI
jgi:hypothetical protein